MRRFFMGTLTWSGLVAALVLLVPIVALACPSPSTAPSQAKSWSSVTVHQQQSADSASQVTFNQAAHAEVTNSLGDVFVRSAAAGEQSLEAHKGSQEQSLHVGSRLNWHRNQNPAAFTARTNGQVNQSQNGWSSSPMDASQAAKIWQGTRQGNTWLSSADSMIAQDITNADGDLSQTQSLAGKTRARGHVAIPQPSCSWCQSFSSWGGSFHSRVTVVVDNFFKF